MAEELLDPMAQYQEPEVIPEGDTGGLPSVQEENAVALENFQFTDEQVAKYFKNGKLQGRFDNIEGVLNTLKSVEDKYSNLVREQKAQANAEPTIPAEEVVAPLIDKFIANGMELTDEILAEAQEKGLDVRDVKLTAIEIKEQVAKAHAVVGGAEEYNAMIEWGKTNLTDAQKSEFDKGLKTSMSAYAIKGLYADYKAATSGNQEQSFNRLSGETANAPSTGGYNSQAEIMKDRAYLNTPAGQRDKGAQMAHKAKLDRTPEYILYGR